MKNRKNRLWELRLFLDIILCSPMLQRYEKKIIFFFFVFNYNFPVLKKHCWTFFFFRFLIFVYGKINQLIFPANVGYSVTENYFSVVNAFFFAPKNDLIWAVVSAIFFFSILLAGTFQNFHIFCWIYYIKSERVFLLILQRCIFFKKILLISIALILNCHKMRGHV